MPKISKEIKEQIKLFSRKSLEDIVIKLASNKGNYDYLLVNYLDKESGEKELYQEALADIDFYTTKNYKGFSEQLRLANFLSACIKRINEFTKISKNKKLEADLILYVLEIPFSYSTKMLGTCFTQYDYKVGLLVKRLMTIVTKKLHEDYKLDYADKINEYLSILHSTSTHIDFIYAFPKSI